MEKQGRGHWTGWQHSPRGRRSRKARCWGRLGETTHWKVGEGCGEILRPIFEPTVAWSPGSTEGMCLVHGEPDTNPQQDLVQTFQLSPRGTALCPSGGVEDPDPGGILQHHLDVHFTFQPPLHCLAVHEAWLLPARCPRVPDGLTSTLGWMWLVVAQLLSLTGVALQEWNPVDFLQALHA